MHIYAIVLRLKSSDVVWNISCMKAHRISNSVTVIVLWYKGVFQVWTPKNTNTLSNKEKKTFSILRRQWSNTANIMTNSERFNLKPFRSEGNVHFTMFIIACGTTAKPDASYLQSWLLLFPIITKKLLCVLLDTSVYSPVFKALFWG